MKTATEVAIMHEAKMRSDLFQQQVIELKKKELLQHMQNTLIYGNGIADFGLSEHINIPLPNKVLAQEVPFEQLKRLLEEE